MQVKLAESSRDSVQVIDWGTHAKPVNLAQAQSTKRWWGDLQTCRMPRHSSRLVGWGLC